MVDKGTKNAILIGIFAIFCVGILLAGILFPFANNNSQNEPNGSNVNGTPLTVYDDTIIEPGSNKINGLTNEAWFSELLEDDSLNFAKEDLGETEFSSDNDNDRNSDDGLYGGQEATAKDADTSEEETGDWSAPAADDIPRDIEEADIIKLVDDTLYILNTYRGLMIIDVTDPDNPSLTSRVPLFGYPVEMYIVEPKAYIVLTHYYNAFLWAEDNSVAPEFRRGSEVLIVDLTDLEKPSVEQYIELNGFVTNTRRVGEVIYAVVNNYDDIYGIYGLEGVGMDTAVGVKRDAGRGGNIDSAENEEMVESTVTSEVSDDDYDGEGGTEEYPEPTPDDDAYIEYEEEEAKKAEEEDVDEYYSEELLSSESQEGTVVVSINMEDLTHIVEMDRETFPGTSNQIHVTENAIFVAQPVYDYTSEIFFGDEKGGDEDFDVNYYTKVTYVDISDYHGKIEVRDSYQVPGYLEDRYQMDYYDNTFRIVTHFWGLWGELGSSKLWILDTSDPDNINKLGELEIDDAGTLMATRFAGERAYTIHLPYSIDPLDVLDLSDPSKPVLTDILEMPGWVTYMEVRGNKIIALGVDDSDNQNKVAVSLFDVTDPENAVMKDRVKIGDGYSWSTANWDPKALTIVDEQNLVLVPFESYSYDKNGKYQSFSGLQLVKFDLATNDLTLGGTIEQIGTVERTRATSERIFAISYKQLQVIDAGNLAKPKITATLDLCNNIIDIIPMGDYSVQVISEFDYRSSIQAIKLRTVDSSDPDTTSYLAEKTIVGQIVKYYQNENYIYLIYNKYSEETGQSEGQIVVFDYTDPIKPKQSSSYEIEEYQSNYWGYYSYYDVYYYDWYYYSGSEITDYSFALVDGDLIVYHPSPEYYYNDYKYIDYEDEVVYDESDEVYEEGNKTEPVEKETSETTIETNDENRTEPQPETEQKQESTEPEENVYWNNVNEHLYFYDLSNPTAPKAVGNITIENTSRISGMYVSGSTLYLVQYQEASYYDEYYRWIYQVKYFLTKLDLTNPSEPKLGTAINIPGQFLGLNNAGTVVYTRTSEYDESYNWEQKLNVLEIKDGKAVLSSALDLGDDYANIIIQDTTIIICYNDYSSYYYDDIYYILKDTDGVSSKEYVEAQEPIIKSKIQIIDASTPSNLKLVNTIGLKNYGSIYKYENSKLYLQLSDVNGILIYDLADTSSPEFLGYYPTYGWVNNIAEDAETGRIYLVCGLYGVLMVQTE